MLVVNRKFVFRAVVIPAAALLAIYFFDRFSGSDEQQQQQQQQGGGGLGHHRAHPQPQPHPQPQVQRPRRNNGWTLVLDLDETLVHTNDETTLFRPHVDTFLCQVFDRFDKVVIFTAGTKPYADPILDALESMASIKFHKRLYRDSCTVMPGGGWAKDLTKVQQNIRKVLIVDNMPSSYALQPQCGVPIPSYWGQKNDVELLIMLSTLSYRLSPHKVN